MRVRPWMLDAVVPSMAVLTVVGAGYYHDMDSPGPAAAVLAVVACLVLAARRSHPTATVLASASLVLPMFAIDREMAPYTLLVPAAALFSMVLVGTDVQRVLGGVGFAAVVTASQVLNQHPPSRWISAQHVAWIITPALVVEMARTRRDYRSVVGERLALLRLTREQETARRVADERLRIARELHDVIAHTLTTINVQASVAGHLLDSRPEQARHALSVIEEASRDGLGELRAILGVLRDPDGAAASRTPAPGLDDVPELVESARGTGLRAHLDIVGERPARLPEAVSLAAYRIVQESLTNVARHTAGAGVHVRLSFTHDELAIAVENTQRRRHASTRPSATAPGVGIVGMTERAQALGGTLTTTALETGFLVSARLPLAASP